MKAIILDQAYNELYDAVEYYEGEQNGLAGKGARKRARKRGQAQ